MIPRKRGRPVGTGRKNRELRNSFATTPERSKSPFLLTGSSPPNSYSHSEFKACLLCKYYTVILRGVTSKMLVCSECNRNGKHTSPTTIVLFFCFFNKTFFDCSSRQMLGIRSRRPAPCPGVGMEMPRLPSLQRLQTCSGTGNCDVTHSAWD